MNMKKLIGLCLLMITGLVLVTGCSSTMRPENFIGKATSDMAEPGFWGCTDDVIMTPEEIQAYNEKLRDEKRLNLVDLLKLAPIDVQRVREMMAEYTLPEDEMYFGGQLLTDGDRKHLEKECNLSALKGSTKLRYGILTEPTNVRYLPTDKTLTGDGVTAGSKCFDKLQATRFRFGEGVLIYHTSLSGDFSFVQGANYYGWIRTDHIAFCSEEEFEQYLMAKDFWVTTALEEVNLNGKNMRLSMGTKINRVGDQAVIPSRDEHGNYVPVTIDKPKAALSKGYLPYTTNNTYRLAMAQLGDVYDWGGQNGHYDCSDLIMSIYSVMGIQIPRDRIVQMKTGNVDASDPDFEKKLKPGAILCLKGHYELYLGQVNGEIYALHCISAYYDEKKQYHEPFRTVITSINDIYRGTGKSHRDSILNAKIIN